MQNADSNIFCLKCPYYAIFKVANIVLWVS